MDYLIFDIDEVAEGIATLEATASTPAGRHAAVMAEVQQVLDWAWRMFPDTHGPIDDGMDWDHDLQSTIEDGGWHRVTLTLTAVGPFVDEFTATFGSVDDCLEIRVGGPA
ncbi:MAG: hypothetical protein KGL18_03045 [Burkholderiales bacterium]|nr:hypothetical protein [Burkholderiales bacterium]MDE1928099.1 hypothetical protein [Burkholderiales bacterium]MDE2501942.1 hypothetical protein [Burkholderiales bacterium]